ncbi:uncharacterized protein LOC110076956 isoform X2 [Pogona vitticeps]
MAFLVAFIYPLLQTFLIYHVGAMEVFRVRPFDNISLPCNFSFVDSTDGLSFSWEREDIKEEHEVEDKEFYKFLVGLQDFYLFYPKLIYSFSNNKEQVEERNSLYEGRVWVDEEEIPEGSLALILEQIQFSDEALYICKATNAKGRGQRKMKLIVEDAEEPQVQFSTVDETLVAKCISTGWYHMPKRGSTIICIVTIKKQLAKSNFYSFDHTNSSVWHRTWMQQEGGKTHLGKILHSEREKLFS